MRDNLSSTPEAWLVNRNCNSPVDWAAPGGVKSEAALPHSGEGVNCKNSPACLWRLQERQLSIIVADSFQYVLSYW